MPASGGGTEDRNQDICAGDIVASLYASSCDGGKGGDIYYIGSCEGGLISRVAIADVVGHGQVVSDMSQYLYNSLRAHMCDPDSSKILSEINQLAARRGLNALTTAAIVACDADEQQLRISYAGHPPVLFKRAGEQTWSAIAADDPNSDHVGAGVNLPMAVDADTIYTQQVIPVTPGDRLFIYSDGVTEAPNVERVQFGIGRLNEVLNSNAGAALSELKSAVLEALHRHASQVLTHDDVTLIAMEVGQEPTQEY